MIIKRILSELLSIIVGVSSFGGGLSHAILDAELDTDAGDIYAVYRDILNYKTEEVVNNLAEIDTNYDNESIVIKRVKLLHDFGDGEYVLAEFENAGYYIYDPDSGIVVESSLTAISPYSEFEDSLYYIGPNEYYHWNEEENGYEYTLNHEMLDSEIIGECERVSQQIKNELYASADIVALSIQNGTVAAENCSISATDATGWAYVQNYSFFQNLKKCGYCEVDDSGNKVSSGGNGICGYIAAGMLLTYDTVCNGKRYVAASYYSRDSSGNISIAGALPYVLYKKGVSLGYGAATTSVAIHYTVEGYLAAKNRIVSHVSYYPPFANNVTEASYLNDDRPVIWFGAISGTGSHAVVVYGYKMTLTGYQYIAHFGWNNHNAVSFTGVIGSMYTYDI